MFTLEGLATTYKNREQGRENLTFLKDFENESEVKS